MAKQTIERTDFHNPGTATIVFEQGTSPNDYPEKITVEPGVTYKGYKNYAPFYKRKGLLPGPSPTATKMREEAVLTASEAAQMKADAEASKLEALEAKREAAAIQAEAQVAMAEAESLRAQAALVDQIDEDDQDVETQGDDSDHLAPVELSPAQKGAATRAANAAKKDKDK